MYDLTIALPNRPGALAHLGRTLGASGISVEGGGAAAVGGRGMAHLLFDDGPHAADVLRRAGIDVVAVRPVLLQRLRQDEAGQLGSLCGRMADAGVSIEVLYSDHAGQLVLVVDDHIAGRRVSEAWSSDG